MLEDGGDWEDRYEDKGEYEDDEGVRSNVERRGGRGGGGEGGWRTVRNTRLTRIGRSAGGHKDHEGYQDHEGHQDPDHEGHEDHEGGVDGGRQGLRKRPRPRAQGARAAAM